MKSIKKPDNHDYFFQNMMQHYTKGQSFDAIIPVAVDYVRDAYMFGEKSRHLVTEEVMHWKRVLYCAHYVDLG